MYYSIIRSSPTEERKAFLKELHQEQVIRNISRLLPENSTQVKEIGHDWYSFTLDDKKFIFRFRNGFSALTQNY